MNEQASVAERQKPLIGLTGGIASGKSTVARFLRELGVAVVDADALAREVVAKGTPGLAEVIEAFGSDVLAADGSLDRAKLAQRVFSDTEARAKLTAITHPKIAALSAERIGLALRTQTPYVVYEAALLVETGIHSGMNALVVVGTDEATQVGRAVARDGMTVEASRARIAAQAPLAAKLAVADYVIHNDGDLDALRASTHAVHEQILARFGSGA